MTKQTEVVQLHKHRKVKNGEPRFLEIGTFDGPSGAKIYWRQIVGFGARQHLLFESSLPIGDQL
jgi:hypothetical protein